MNSNAKRCDACGYMNAIDAPHCLRCGASIFSLGDAPPSPGYAPAPAPPLSSPSFGQAPSPPAVHSSYGPSATAQMGMVKCPFCGSVGPPHYQTKISTGGWVVFAVLMVTCLPLFWIGLLMKERVAVCSTCFIKLEN